MKHLAFVCNTHEQILGLKNVDAEFVAAQDPKTFDFDAYVVKIGGLQLARSLAVFFREHKGCRIEKGVVDDDAHSEIAADAKKDSSP